jgi:hypothetical protein
MSQTLSLAKRTKLQKLEAKQNELVEQIKIIQTQPIRSRSGKRNKSDKITDLKTRFDVLKVHAQLQGMAPPSEVAKLMEKHYDAKSLGTSLLGGVIDMIIQRGKSTDNVALYTQEKITTLMNASLDVVKPATKHYTDKEVIKIIKDYGTNITGIHKDIKEAIVKKEKGEPYQGSIGSPPALAYTEADKGESNELATEMVAEKKAERIKRLKKIAAAGELKQAVDELEDTAKTQNYTVAQAKAIVAKDIRDESYYPEKAKVPKLTKTSEIVDTTPKPVHINKEAVNKMAGANEVLKKLDHQVQQHKVSLNYNKPNDLTDVLKKLGY